MSFSIPKLTKICAPLPDWKIGLAIYILSPIVRLELCNQVETDDTIKVSEAFYMQRYTPKPLCL